MQIKYPSSPYINASFIDVEADRFEVQNPYNKQILASLPLCTQTIVEQAIEGAHSYQQIFQRTTPVFRSSLLESIEFALQEHEQELAICITEENGKPLSESLAEVRYTMGYFRWYKGLCERIHGQIMSHAPYETQNIIRVQKRPVGVCAMITPWNFPLAMLGRKVAMAFAAGCCVVAKPSEETPLSALLLAQIFDKLQLPAGLFQVVFGDANMIGQIFCSDTRIAKISFTGSTRVGRMLQKQSASTLKRVSLELGGNAPFIVFDDANIHQAIEGTMVAKFRNCGQTCIAANRFLIQQNIKEIYIEQLITAVKKLQIGDGSKVGTNIGPLINSTAKEKITQLIEDALQKGARIRYGDLSEDPLLQSPIILDHISPHMSIWNTEIFGPVIAIRTFETEQDAIDMANDTEHGLASYFYSTNTTRQWRLPTDLQYGMVGVNTGKISTPLAPFGGIKQSGLGREGSDEGLDSYLETQYINTNFSD